MGFFSSILGGGSKSTSSSGYGALPKVAQDAMDEVTRRGQSLLLGSGGADLFRPMPQTGAETQAFNLMQQPLTSQGVSDIVGRFQNPYMDSVVGDINREAEGNFSLYKQALSGAGQMGSNREFVNAAAADEARLRAIEQAKRESYNSALNTGLAQNQQSIGNLMTQGDFTRGLDSQTRTGELTALQQMAGLLGVYPASQTQTQTSGGGGLGSLLTGIGSAGSLLGFGGSAAGAAAGGAGTAATVGKIASLLAGFSDARLKENIAPIGEKNGFTLYSFNYKGDETKYTGVMAQEVMRSDPSAVSVIDGFLAVDYDKIGINMGVLNG
ncbi:Intramolecular chaperone auto-processing domain containing protein [uncultured Caudovirales phage]|uniref:Intramolecular chaperone auto-processing domain containing protein n=1 Tax=uncultured Caudovirales phage TaxID=2100421 RepID=A0A6J5NY21_9CAUD|nr:Intramolecular chaperone auto-processing domain containing protein [uncultured Caudovirales phage]